MKQLITFNEKQFKLFEAIDTIKSVIATIYVHDEELNSYSSKCYYGIAEFKDEVSLMNALNNINEINYYEKASRYYCKDSKTLIVYLNDKAHNENRSNIEKIFEIANDSALMSPLRYFRNKCKTVKGLKRLRKGYVFGSTYIEPTEYHEDIYRGGLTFLYDHPRVKEYLSPHGVWGYLGHENRMTFMDVVIEELVNQVKVFENVREHVGHNVELDNVLPIAEWFTSSYARHFMDNVEDYSLEVFRAVFRNEIMSGVYKDYYDGKDILIKFPKIKKVSVKNFNLPLEVEEDLKQALKKEDEKLLKANLYSKLEEDSSIIKVLSESNYSSYAKYCIWMYDLEKKSLYRPYSIYKSKGNGIREAEKLFKNRGKI